LGSLAADAALLLVALIWGTTFVVVKVAVETVDPLAFVAARFAVGSLAVAALSWPRLRRASAAAWRAGALLGVALFAGFASQTIGLRESTPARAAFITGLNVVLVPLFAAALTGRRPGRAAWLGVAFSFAGMALLSAPLTAEGWSAGNWRGDALVLACAVAFALHIVGVGHVAGRHDAAAITAVQLVAVAALALLASGLGGARPPLEASSWPAIAYMGLVATGLVFLLQNWAQIHTSPTHTALIFALEPVFAAFFSRLFYGEALTGRVAAGGLLIVAGMVVSELAGREPTPPTG
jgi:drug/metabolite transporter (DMT)-like permease